MSWGRGKEGGEQERVKQGGSAKGRRGGEKRGKSDSAQGRQRGEEMGTSTGDKGRRRSEFPLFLHLVRCLISGHAGVEVSDLGAGGWKGQRDLRVQSLRRASLSPR